MLSLLVAIEERQHHKPIAKATIGWRTSIYAKFPTNLRTSRLRAAELRDQPPTTRIPTERLCNFLVRPFFNEARVAAT